MRVFEVFEQFVRKVGQGGQFVVSETSILLEMDVVVEVEQLSLDVGVIVLDRLDVIGELLALVVMVVNRRSQFWMRDLRRTRKLSFHTT